MDAETIESRKWSGARPEVAVVIATHRRPQLLGQLLDRLAHQTIGLDRFEIVVVDDGSADATEAMLRREVERTALTLRVVLLPESRGPARARNAGVAASRAPVVEFTDDDCWPEDDWVLALLKAFGSGAAVVQGHTSPPPSEPSPGPWARTIHVDGMTGLFETCNIAYQRSWFDRVGGFDEDDPLTGRLGHGAHFGEDVVLGGRVVTAGGTAVYAPEAVVHHRWEPATYAHFVRARWRLAGFPALADHSPTLAERLVAKHFLSRRTLVTDAAVAGGLLAVLTRRSGPLVLAAPWLAQRWPEAKSRAAGRPPALRLAQLGVADLVGLAALVVGSARHRRVVL